MPSSHSTSSYSFMSDDAFRDSHPHRHPHRRSFFFETQVSIDGSENINNMSGLNHSQGKVPMGYLNQYSVTGSKPLYTNNTIGNRHSGTQNNDSNQKNKGNVNPLPDEDSEKEIRESFRNSDFFAVYLDPKNFEDMNTSMSCSSVGSGLTNDSKNSENLYNNVETNTRKRSNTKNSQSTAPSSGRIKVVNTSKVIPPNPVASPIRHDFTPQSNETSSTVFFETSENIYQESNNNNSNHAYDDIHGPILSPGVSHVDNLDRHASINGSTDSSDSIITQDTNILNPQHTNNRGSRETKTISTSILTNSNFNNFSKLIDGEGHHNQTDLLDSNKNSADFSIKDNHVDQFVLGNDTFFQTNESAMDSTHKALESSYIKANTNINNSTSNDDSYTRIVRTNTENSQTDHIVPSLGPIPNVNTSLSSNEYSRGYQYDVSSLTNFHGYDDTIEPNIEKAVRLLREDITTSDNTGFHNNKSNISKNNDNNDNNNSNNIQGKNIIRHELNVPFESSSFQNSNLDVHSHTSNNSENSDQSNESDNKPGSYELHELKIPRRLSSATNPSSGQNSLHLPRSPSLINRILVTPSPKKVNRTKSKISRPISFDKHNSSTYSNNIISPNSNGIPSSPSIIPKVHVFQTVTGSNRWRTNPVTETQQLTLGNDAFATPRKKLPNKWKNSPLHLKRLSFREEEEYGLDDIDEQESKKINSSSDNSNNKRNLISTASNTNTNTINSVSTNKLKFDDFESHSNNQMKSLNTEQGKSNDNKTIPTINSHEANLLENPYEEYNPYMDQTPFAMRNAKYKSNTSGLDDNFKLEIEQRLMTMHDEMLNEETNLYINDVKDTDVSDHINNAKTRNSHNYSFEMSRNNTVKKADLSKPNAALTNSTTTKNPPHYMRANTTTPMLPAELPHDISGRYVQHIDTPSIESFDSVEYKFFEVYSLKKLVLLYAVGILIPPVSFIIGCGSSNSDGTTQGGGGIINDLKLMQMVINKQHRVGLLRGFIWDLDLNWLRRSMLLIGIIEMTVIFAGVGVGMGVGLTVGQ